MTRVHPILPDEAEKNLKEVYSAIERKMGRLPNIFLNMGNSLPVLKGYLALNETLNQTSLSAKLREYIALVVGQSNQCQYCLSAHTAAVHNMGITDHEILQVRKALSTDPKVQAILSFVKTVVDKRAQISTEEVAKLKEAGVSDQEIVELVLVITINIFTNYFNLITDPLIDFPVAQKSI